MSIPGDYECNCRVCNNDDAPEVEEHETCSCSDCHDQGSHDPIDQWASECEWCDDTLVERAIEEAKEAERERMDLQKGDQS